MIDIEKIFSFQIFFIFLRESLEIIVIISILLTVVKQALFEKSQADDTGSSRSLAGGDAAQRLTAEEEEVLDESTAVPEPRDQSPITENGGGGASSHVTDVPMNGLPGEGANNYQLYKKLKVQILSGGILGLSCCLLIGGAFIVTFYLVGADLWSASEHYYEGVLSVVASVIISVMGLFFLRMGKLREKFRVKLASIIYSRRGRLLHDQSERAVRFTEKYALFILPFVTSLREGLEAVVFVGGIGIDQPLSSIPLSMVSAIAVSSILGYFFYKSSKSFSLQVCLVVTTCFLYLIASGLFSKGVWQFEVQRYVDLCNGQDMSEVGSGPGSYDITRSIWHVNCCNGERDGLWMIFTAVFGWTNSATYSSVLSYCLYWLLLIGIINILSVEEKVGYIPYVPVALQKKRILKRLHIVEKSLQLRHLSGGLSSLPSDCLERRISKDSQTSASPLLGNGQQQQQQQQQHHHHHHHDTIAESVPH
ncbi:LAMI_0E06744g1_1 [Lachancea mirantina]|uniref:LAMI_0E06744g1_1 n=1 Tax=Lachancea mirantina TaxID=1230905 RepID=A0A1G4JM12_9SACH|nr:LAMI_0E06744g1_1 [Lachancea mirantina]